MKDQQSRSHRANGIMQVRRQTKRHRCSSMPHRKQSRSSNYQCLHARSFSLSSPLFDTNPISFSHYRACPKEDQMLQLLPLITRSLNKRIRAGCPASARARIYALSLSPPPRIDEHRYVCIVRTHIVNTSRRSEEHLLISYKCACHSS